MNTAPFADFVRDLHARQFEAEASDAELLDLFCRRRCEAAFAALVRRHGPMVLGVCQRVLGRGPDADDAFQATFLVLVRKAGSLRSRHLLANWLYGVAFNVARKLRHTNAVRAARERPMAVLPDVAVRPPGVSGEVLGILDDELARLPDKYRAPIVLCDLEGATRREAAQALGWPEGTVAGRLARGRALLGRRLSARGVTSAAAVPVPLATPLVASTVQAALRPAAVAPAVAALTQGVLRTMFLKKLLTGGVVGVGCALALTGGLVWSTAMAQIDPPKPPAAQNAAEPPAPKNEYAIAGRVLDADGKAPLEGVRVTVHAGIGTLGPVAEATTGKDGRFRLAFPVTGRTAKGHVAVVWARKPGFYCWTYGWRSQYTLTDKPPTDTERQASKYDLLAPGAEAPLEFRMAPAAALRARLVDGQGKPMAGGPPLTLTGERLPPASNVLSSGETDANGVFVVRDVPLGRFRLVLEDKADVHHALELGSVEFGEAVEYTAEATVFGWTPESTHAALKVTRPVKAGR